MKNRCIIAKTPDNATNFICLSENDSIIATNMACGIRLDSFHGTGSFVFSINENEIKDQLYDRLCYFLRYGEALVIKNRNESCWVSTFDVEQQIEDIKKRI